MAEEIQRVADDYVQGVAALDAGFVALLLREHEGGLSRWDKAEADSLLRGLASLALAGRETVLLDLGVDFRQLDASWSQVEAVMDKVSTGLRRAADAQPTMDAWEELVSGRQTAGEEG